MYFITADCVVTAQLDALGCDEYVMTKGAFLDGDIGCVVTWGLSLDTDLDFSTNGATISAIDDLGDL